MEVANILNIFDSKGWVAMTKLKKIQEGLVRFGCNLGQLIAYLCRL